MSDTGQILITTDGPTCLVALSGDIDIHSVDVTDHDLEPCSTAETVEIDVSEVGFIDSVGITLLLRVRQAAGGNPVLRGPSDRVTRVLELVGISQLFEIVPA